MNLPYRLESIAFLSGMAIMILELVGSRILAPYVGASLFVWTNLIGIILASLSIGYWLGGKITSHKPSFKTLSIIILYAAVTCAFTTFYYSIILDTIYQLELDNKVSALISSIVLFAPTSLLLGMISPYVVNLKLTDIRKTGRTVGNLYALSTIGSIAGTFFTGYILLSLVGSHYTMTIIFFLLIALSFVAYIDLRYKFRLILIIVIYLLYLAVPYIPVKQVHTGKALYIGDSAYSRIAVVDMQHPENNRPVRYLYNDNLTSSAMYLDNSSEELVFPYSELFQLADYFNPSIRNALLIGAGAYSFPKFFVATHSEAILDVIEIDPTLTRIAQQYFNLHEQTNMNIYHEDGRTFLNRTNKQYDAIYLDAYSTYSPPFHLTTIESVKKIYQLLSENGVVMSNILSSIEGENGKILRSQYYTYKQVFPHVYILPTTSRDSNTPQNVVLVALKKLPEPDRQKTSNYEHYLSRMWMSPLEEDVPILTDDFAPVEFFTQFTH